MALYVCGYLHMYVRRAAVKFVQRSVVMRKLRRKVRLNIEVKLGGAMVEKLCGALRMLTIFTCMWGVQQ